MNVEITERKNNYEDRKRNYNLIKIIYNLLQNILKNNIQDDSESIIEVIYLIYDFRQLITQ